VLCQTEAPPTGVEMSIRVTLLGVVSAFMANILFLGGSYMIHYVKDLRPTEILFARGLLQIALFGTGAVIIRLIRKWRDKKSPKHDEPSTQDSLEQDKIEKLIDATMKPDHEVETPSQSSSKISRWKVVLTVVVANAGLAVISYLYFTALKMMPVSDFMVFVFSTPILDLLLSSCILKTKLHLVNLSLCCLIPVGTVFVAQPTFIFGMTGGGGGAGGDEKSEEYLQGIGILMAAAVINAISNVLQALYKVHSFDFMLCGGLVSILVSGGVGAAVTSFQWHHVLQVWPSLLLVSAISVVANLTVYMSLQLIQPVLMSAVRCLEIVMALAVDLVIMAVTSQAEDTPQLALKVFGSLLVTAAVMTLGFADVIYTKTVARYRRTPGTNQG